MTVPDQKPGRSETIVATPTDFMTAVRKRFGVPQWDLAADNANTLGAIGYYGPGSPDPDSLIAPWPITALCWLNPPYSNIKPWTAKCVETAANGGRILLLVPASVGAEWFNLYVRPSAFIFELTPRLTFVGHSTPYPKDLILAYYGPEGFVGRTAWRWKTKPLPVPANDNAIDPRQLPLALEAV